MNAHTATFESIALPREELIALASRDYDTFAGLLIPDVLENDIDVYQRRVFWRMVSEQNLRYACALPRGHIKTTLLKLAIVYIVTYQKPRFPVFFAGTHALAESAVSDIVNIFSSAAYASVYGAPTFTTSRGSRGEFEFDCNQWVLSASGTFVAVSKRVRLMGRSSGQSVRGMSKNFRRPDFIAFDDIDQDETGEVSYNALKDWVYGPVLKLGYKNTRVVHIGNYIERQTVIGDHIGDPAWVSDHFSALLPDGSPLWPGYWTRDELLRDFAAYARQGKTQKWFAEMLNNPLENAEGLIALTDIRQLPEAVPKSGSHVYCFLTVDPAISKSKRANHMVIAVHGFNQLRQVWQCLELVYQLGRDPIDLYRKLIELSDKWGINTWGIEAVAYQAALVAMYPRFLKNAQRKINVVATPGSNRSKADRITSWIGLVKSGNYCLTEGMFTIIQNMLAYKPSEDDQIDDDLDAAAYFIPMFLEFSHMIAAAGDDMKFVTEAGTVVSIDHFIPR